MNLGDNMNILIGKVVSTHGIKGELKILSDFPYKDKVFIVGNKLIIDDKEYTGSLISLLENTDTFIKNNSKITNIKWYFLSFLQKHNCT